MTTVVWFKRDLRVQDHGPLTAAAALGEPLIPLYVAETGYWQQADTSARQWDFAKDCLTELDRSLKKAGSGLLIRSGDVLDVLRDLHARTGLTRIFAHQETGGRWTYDRDRAVIHWCQEQGIEFREWQQFGVVRRLQNRDIWDQAWQNTLAPAPLPGPSHLPSLPDSVRNPGWTEPVLRWQTPCPDRQPGGSHRADALLNSFLARRCVGYQYNLSSPVTALRGCSRLSPHLAWVPADLIHTPWLMSAAQKQRFGGLRYPAPVCDHEQAARSARKAVGAWQQQVSTPETRRVLARHSSRKGPVQHRPKLAGGSEQGPSGADHPSPQLSLFD